MLEKEDYSYLKLLYEQFLKMNNHIKELILSSKWDEVDIAIQQKNSIQKQIILFEKPRLKDIKNTDELNSLRENLIKLEIENLELVKTQYQQIQNELKNLKKTKKLMSAYEPQVQNTVSTFEVKEED